jgi:hypothetical protein
LDEKRCASSIVIQSLKQFWNNLDKTLFSFACGLAFLGSSFGGRAELLWRQRWDFSGYRVCFDAVVFTGDLYPGVSL